MRRRGSSDNQSAKFARWEKDGYFFVPQSPRQANRMMWRWIRAPRRRGVRVGKEKPMTRMELVPVDPEEARRWSHQSLEQGSLLSLSVERRLDRPLSAGVLMPGKALRAPGLLLDDESKGLDLGDAYRALAALVRETSGVLIVDDDISSRGDPGLDDAGFVGDRVIRWAPSSSEPSELIHLIRMGASGYPFNAILCDADAASGLKLGGTLDGEDCVRLADATRLIIHAVFDAESFLVITLDEATGEPPSVE